MVFGLMRWSVSTPPHGWCERVESRRSRGRVESVRSWIPFPVGQCGAAGLERGAGRKSEEISAGAGGKTQRPAG